MSSTSNPAARTAFRRQPRCREPDHDRVVTSKHQVDHDHLEQDGCRIVGKDKEIAHAGCPAGQQQVASIVQTRVK